MPSLLHVGFVVLVAMVILSSPRLLDGELEEFGVKVCLLLVSAVLAYQSGWEMVGTLYVRLSPEGR